MGAQGTRRRRRAKVGSKQAPLPLELMRPHPVTPKPAKAKGASSIMNGLQPAKNCLSKRRFFKNIAPEKPVRIGAIHHSIGIR